MKKTLSSLSYKELYDSIDFVPYERPIYLYVDEDNNLIPYSRVYWFLLNKKKHKSNTIKEYVIKDALLLKPNPDQIKEYPELISKESYSEKLKDKSGMIFYSYSHTEGMKCFLLKIHQAILNRDEYFA